MLEIENSSESNEPTQTAKPATRRRRAASRPAGTPEATQAAEVAPAAPVEAEVTPKRRRATKPAAQQAPMRRRKVALPDEEASVAEIVVAEAPAEAKQSAAEPAKPARTRRATRKSAPPAQVAQPSAEPVTAEPVAAEPGPEEAPAAEPAPKTTRRRATKPKAEQAEPVPMAAPVAEVPPVEPEEAPKAPARRRRATRAAAAPEPVVAPVAKAAEPDSTTPVVEPAVQAAPAPVAAAAAEESPAPTRRRRATRAAAAPAPVVVAAPVVDEDPVDDPIGAALRAAEDLAEARKSVLADPFITKEAREAQLAALAGAIAAADAADDDEDDEEEDAESHEDDEASDDEADDSGDEDGERPARRRRRRGGRRRRRGGSRDEEDNDEPDESDGEQEPQGEESSLDDSEDREHTEGDSSSTTRRRRRRRRRGDSDKEGSPDNDEVTGIEGSTRMEAKRQRRKESRAAGRRRAPILSEAEFLARRESVERTMVIRQREDYTQLAVIEDDILVEHYVDKASATSLIGNIYLGKVQNVLPSMEAAFIDIGRGRNAVLYAGEVDWASFGVTGENRKVENVLKSGQSVLVQVTKDPVGAKGARLTSHISLPGRYIVYSPGGHLSGISRKLPDSERQRLRSVLGQLISDEESVIVRTAAEGVSEDELVRDVNRLKAQWEVIEKKSKQGGAPQALYAEPDLTLRIVRDLFTEDFSHLIVQGNGEQDDAFDAISAYVGHVAPHLLDRVERFDGDADGLGVFAKFRVDEQIAKALDRKVYLPSGGSLVIDRTEAMTVIDVNTGRFTGSAGNLEATVTSNNLEAAEEIVRQLRLRDLGGIIVIDFIDMVLPSNRDLLLRRLVECLGRDRTRHQVAEVTSLGLVQLTRKRIGTGLQEAFTEQCEHCHGAGYLRFGEPVDSQAPADGGDRRSNGRRRRK